MRPKRSGWYTNKFLQQKRELKAIRATYRKTNGVLKYLEFHKLKSLRSSYKNKVWKAKHAYYEGIWTKLHFACKTKQLMEFWGIINNLENGNKRANSANISESCWASYIFNLYGASADTTSTNNIVFQRLTPRSLMKVEHSGMNNIILKPNPKSMRHGK